MSLFDPDAWDGNVESLPAVIRAKMEGQTPVVKSPEQLAADDALLEDRVQRLLNKRNVDAHLSAIQLRAPADTFAGQSAKFRTAVTNGGLTVDQATDLFFPKGSDGVDTLTPPPRDPAGTAGGLAPPPNAQAGVWTQERVAEQLMTLRKMPMSKALAWRRDPANAAFLKEEMKSYSAGSSL